MPGGRTSPASIANADSFGPKFSFAVGDSSARGRNILAAGRSSPAGQKNSTCRPCRPVCFHRNDLSVGPAPTPRRESCPDRPTRRVAWWWLEPRGVHLEHGTVRGTFAGSNLTAKSDPQRRASWTLHLPRSASAGSPRRRRRRGRIVRPGMLRVTPNHLATDLAP